VIGLGFGWAAFFLGGFSATILTLASFFFPKPYRLRRSEMDSLKSGSCSREQPNGFHAFRSASVTNSICRLLKYFKIAPPIELAHIKAEWFIIVYPRPVRVCWDVHAFSDNFGGLPAFLCT
jgi:hypothetical protein